MNNLQSPCHQRKILEWNHCNQRLVCKETVVVLLENQLLSTEIHPQWRISPLILPTSKVHLSILPSSLFQSSLILSIRNLLYNRQQIFQKMKYPCWIANKRIPRLKGQNVLLYGCDVRASDSNQACQFYFARHFDPVYEKKNVSLWSMVQMKLLNIAYKLLYGHVRISSSTEMLLHSACLCLLALRENQFKTIMFPPQSHTAPNNIGT